MVAVRYRPDEDDRLTRDILVRELSKVEKPTTGTLVDGYPVIFSFLSPFVAPAWYHDFFQAPDGPERLAERLLLLMPSVLCLEEKEEGFSQARIYLVLQELKMMIEAVPAVALRPILSFCSIAKEWAPQAQLIIMGLEGQITKVESGEGPWYYAVEKCEADGVLAITVASGHDPFSGLCGLTR